MISSIAVICYSAYLSTILYKWIALCKWILSFFSPHTTCHAAYPNQGLCLFTEFSHLLILIKCNASGESFFLVLVHSWWTLQSLKYLLVISQGFFPRWVFHFDQLFFFFCVYFMDCLSQIIIEEMYYNNWGNAYPALEQWFSWSKPGWGFIASAFVAGLGIFWEMPSSAGHWWIGCTGQQEKEEGTPRETVTRNTLLSTLKESVHTEMCS